MASDLSGNLSQAPLLLRLPYLAHTAYFSPRASRQDADLMCLQEEAKAVKLFEELLDSAASAADSQALHTATESSHISSAISSATGKAYRALKELVKAAHPRMAYDPRRAF